MTQGTEPSQTERERLIFGAGFAFGVTFALLILGVVLSPVVSEPVGAGSLLASAVWLPIAAAITFAAVVGVALYVLALPDQGFGIPRRPVAGGDPGEVDTE